MGVLETVFNSRKFDLNDDVLMEFNNYFDEKSRDYNSFCLDEEDITSLRNLVAQMLLTQIVQFMYLLMAMKLQIVKEKNQHTPMLFGLTQFCLFPK